MPTYNEIRNTQTGQVVPEQPVIQPSVNSNQLTAPELAALLDTVKKTTFLGEQVEVVYNMVLKLQNQYIEQATKKQ